MIKHPYLDGLVTSGKIKRWRQIPGADYPGRPPGWLYVVTVLPMQMFERERLRKQIAENLEIGTELVDMREEAE